jgi:hypothetical protein
VSASPFEPSELPLAAAQRRLGRPGRPRKPNAAKLPAPAVNLGRQAGRGRAPVREASAPSERFALTRTSEAVITVSAPNARLLSVKNASRYLGVSTWVTWRLIKTGVLPPVVIPEGTKGAVARTLVDREDLDKLIPRWKQPR